MASARVTTFAAAVLLLAACAPQHQKAADVLSTGGAKDGGKGSGTTVVYATTNCTAPNSDGVRCNEKTCKADSKSDCTDFAKGCVEYGNYYKGSNDAGTCTRVV